MQSGMTELLLILLRSSPPLEPKRHFRQTRFQFRVKRNSEQFRLGFQHECGNAGVKAR